MPRRLASVHSEPEYVEETTMTKKNRGSKGQTAGTTETAGTMKTHRVSGNDALGRRAKAKGLRSVPADDAPEPWASRPNRETQNSVDATDSVDVTSESTIGNSAAVNEPLQTGETTMSASAVTLTLARVKTNGVAAYVIPGAPGLVRISKAAFGGAEPPQSIVIDAANLAQPNAEKAAKMQARLERRGKLAQTREERIAKRNDRIAKAEARLVKERARLQKEQALLAKANKNTGDRQAAQNAAVSENLGNEGQEVTQ
jgi:hypothetical protein